MVNLFCLQITPPYSQVVSWCILVIFQRFFQYQNLLGYLYL